MTTGIYRKTPSFNGYLGILVHTSIPIRESDTTMILEEKYEHAPDLLALDLYGDPELWWVIPQRNGLEDPIFDMKRDTKLTIPSFETVKDII